MARIVAASDASVGDDADEDLVLVTSSRVLPLSTEVSGSLLCTPEVASDLPKGRRWIHEQALWAMASLLGEVEGEQNVLHPFEQPCGTQPNRRATGRRACRAPPMSTRARGSSRGLWFLAGPPLGATASLGPTRSCMAKL